MPVITVDLFEGRTREQKAQYAKELTELTMRVLGPDPDADMEAFEGRRATSADQEVDANPGGYRSSAADKLIASARKTTDQGTRTDLYGRLQDVLESDVPAWPVWYDTAWSAIADRARGPDGPIDVRLPRYAWDVAGWTLRSPAP